MASKFVFDNKLIELPGAYATIKSGIKNPPAQASYGNILIIDNGSGATFGGGSGIDGALAKGQDSVYSFDNIDDFRAFVKGGYWWLLADPLFFPLLTPGVKGVSRIYFAKAATTTAAEMTFQPTGGGAAGGTNVIQVRDEGVIGNGVETSSVLTKGYCFTFHAGEIDAAKFMLKFWVGQYKGAYTDSIPYDEVTAAQTTPKLLMKSIEFANVAELYAWEDSDPTFNAYFKAKTKTVTGTGVVAAGDLIAITGNRLATGATESYTSGNLDTVLDAVKELDYTFIFSDQAGADAKGSLNGKMLAHILNEAKFEKFLWVGGGDDSTKFEKAVSNSSCDIAAYYNSDRVITCHGAVYKNSTAVGTGLRQFNVMYKAAAMLGRTCGCPPQVPTTFKGIQIDGEVHKLNDKQKKTALKYGVLASYWDDDLQNFTILQDVNTLQNNTYLVNNDGTTYSIQLRRITSQLNKELVINAKKELLSDPNGVNRNTLSAEFLRDWVIGYLRSRTATKAQDNLIISFQDVTVTLQQDAYFVTYGIVPNSEITKLFMTGFLLQ